MKKDNMNERMDDKLWMKSLMESALKEPSPNLSYRIMHQIETEEAMSRGVLRAKPKFNKQKGNLLIDLRNIFGLMYLFLLITVGYFYVQGGVDAILSETFMWTCISISSIFSLFFLITSIDSSLRRKEKNKP